MRCVGCGEEFRAEKRWMVRCLPCWKEKKIAEKSARPLTERQRRMMSKPGIVTNPSKLTEFYSGEIPPWDESLTSPD